jgi:hypothetical protein
MELCKSRFLKQNTNDEQGMLLVLAFQTVLLLKTQLNEPTDKNPVYKGQQSSANDTTSFLHAIKKGQFHGQVRYFYEYTK